MRERFAAAQTELQQLNRWLYDHPELAWQEHDSCRRVAEFLRAAGFAVELPAYGLETAFAARIGDPAAATHVVLCAEYDALPGIGHACGHNLIACMSAGAGHALAPLADRLGFRLTVLGTPAEECAGGKVELLAAGAFDDADAVMMVHPTPVDLLDPQMLAVCFFDVEYTGRASHAALAPELGINALDAYVQAYTAVAALRQQLPAGTRVHSVIGEGGDAVNVIPARTVSSWCVRAPDAEALAAVRPRVERCLRAAAEATGCTIVIRQAAHDYHELVTDERLAAAFARAAARVGRSMPRAGHGQTSGSTDLGNVSRVVPAIHPCFAIGDGIPNHDPRFAELTIGEEGHRVIHDGVVALALTTIDVVAGASAPAQSGSDPVSIERTMGGAAT